MFFAGLRPGEARGARWENYDGKTLSVKQSVWRKHTTDPKTASAKKPVPVIQPLRELLAQLRKAEGNPANGPILRGLKLSKDGKPKPLNLNALARVIRAALLNRENYRNGQAKDWKPVEWHGYFAPSRHRNAAKHDDPRFYGSQGAVRIPAQHNLNHYIRTCQK